MSRFEDRPSPNHDARPAGGPVDILILHYTGMANGEAAVARLCDAQAKVSCHWVVREDGGLVRIVPEERRAWHAGVSSWGGASDINARSVGIEIVNRGHDFDYPEFPDAQIEATIALSRGILARHPIPPRRVLAHSDVAPARKIDPGEKFPWARLHAAGVGHWVEPVGIAAGPTLGRGDEGAEVADLQAALSHYGYGIEATGAFDARTELVVMAFQRHFRPARVDGIADPSTRETLRRLMA